MQDEMLSGLRARHIVLMRRTCAILGHLLTNVDHVSAQTRRDGPDGWSVLEVVCHLRDFDTIFHERARLMLENDYPTLTPYDHEALAVERAYNQQSLEQVYAELNASRAAFADFFESLDEAGWGRAGHHPERGHFTMLDALLQVGHHDVDHLEQITRILRGHSAR